MQDIRLSRRRTARSLSLLVTPLTAMALALSTLSTQAAAIAPVRDLGVVAPATSVSAVRIATSGAEVMVSLYPSLTVCVRAPVEPR